MPPRFASGFGTYPASDVIFASGDYKAANPTAVEFGTTGAVGMHGVLNITALSGTGCKVTVTVEGYDKASGTWVTVASLCADATGAFRFGVDPRIPDGTGFKQAGLFERMRISAARGGTNTTLTYSVGATLVA